MPHWQPVRDRRRLGEDLRDREAVLAAHRHEDARHQREVERHLALVAADLGVAVVRDDVRGPLVGLGQQHPARVLVLHDLAAAPQEGVRLGQVLAVRAVALEQVGHGVEPEAVDAQVQPEAQDVDHRLLHGLAVVVEVGLVGEEAVPEELAAHPVVGPVRRLGVDEDDPRLGVARVVVRPDVEVAVGAVRVAARLLEPGVLVAGVVHDEVGDHADAALVRLVEQHDEVVDGAELGQHGPEVADVVAAVTQRRVVERRQPDAVDAQPLDVVELLGEPADVAGAVAVRVGERADQHLVEHRPLEPVVVHAQRAGLAVVLGRGLGDSAVGHDGLVDLRVQRT